MKRKNSAGSIASFFAAGVLLVMVLFSSCATGGASSETGAQGHAAVSPDSGGHGHAPEAGGHTTDEGVQEGESSYALTEGVQEIITPYTQLWSSDSITVKAGVPVRWYVEAAPGSLPKMGMACGKTIKIPGLGWGTDSYNDGEGHLTLVEGKNLVYEFTPVEPGEILFTCWMGSECHSNYIHVTAGGAPISDAGRIRGGGEARKIVFRYH
jgi:hypothetical protein